MNDIYIYRMSLLAMQTLQLHEDVKDLLQHYHDDAMAGAVPETLGSETALADTRCCSFGIARFGPCKCNSLPK